LLGFFNKNKKNSSSEKKLFLSVQRIIGLKPKNIAIYQQALRHSSVSVEIKNGVKNSNERLEYLGDAALGLVVAEYLFKLYPFKEEGFLTQMRSRIVNRNRLNQLALKIGLDELVSFELKGNKTKSLYGDALEALIGAIFLDLGYDKAEKFIISRLLQLHLDMREIENTDTDFKSKLLNWGQQNKKKIVFDLEKESGPSHNKIFLVRVLINGVPYDKAEHGSKRRAEQQAAELTINSLGLNI
jgi:ribonuclease-3